MEYKVRGIGNTPSVRYLKKLIKDYRICFLAVLESMIRFSDYLIGRKLKLANVKGND